MAEENTQSQQHSKQHEELHDAPHYPQETQVKIEKVYLGIWLFGTLALILLSSVWTQSPIFLVFLGFLPLLLITLSLFWILEAGLKDIVYWSVPFILSLLFLIIAGMINPLIDFQLNVGGLTVVNLILGLILVLGLIIIEGKQLFPHKPQEVNEENITEFLHGIEDKCKALNFVIGRVYRSSNGGTKEMRERLRIDNEWYNEFNRKSDDPDDQPDALAALHLIKDRLSLFMKKEKDVFSEKELKGLKHIARKKDGEDRIIDVLVTNDRDPVESYYVGAVDAADKILKVIEK